MTMMVRQGLWYRWDTFFLPIIYIYPHFTLLCISCYFILFDLFVFFCKTCPKSCRLNLRGAVSSSSYFASLFWGQIFYNFGQMFALIVAYFWFGKTAESIISALNISLDFRRLCSAFLRLVWCCSFVTPSCDVKKNMGSSLCLDGCIIGGFVCFQMCSSWQAAGLRPGWEAPPFTKHEFLIQICESKCFPNKKHSHQERTGSEAKTQTEEQDYSFLHQLISSKYLFFCLIQSKHYQMSTFTLS